MDCNNLDKQEREKWRVLKLDSLGHIEQISEYNIKLLIIS